MEIEQNLQINMVSCLSKRLLNFCRDAFRPITYLKYIPLFLTLSLTRIWIRMVSHCFGYLDPDPDLYLDPH